MIMENVSVATKAEERDAVDARVALWKRELPELDPAVEGIVERIQCLVKRLPDPSDRRGVLVELTPRGRKVWDRATVAQARKEALVAAALSERELEQLNALLRRLMLAFDER